MFSLLSRCFRSMTLSVPVFVGACATGQGPSLFDAGPGARFSGVSAQQVLARAQLFCADFPVGDQRLGDLLGSDDAFRALTLSFYRGEMSNDAYVDRVLTLHPAADGNVPATGCVISNFNDCLAGNCGLEKNPAKKAPAKKTPAEQAGRKGQAETASGQVAMPVPAKGEMSQAPALEAGLY